MNFQNLFIRAAIGCLLVGVSGAAMAVDCPEGRILFDTVDEIVIDGQGCLVYGTVVEGRVQVTNSPQFEINDSEVGGPIRILGTGAQSSENVTVFRVDVFSGDVEVVGFETAIVAGNTLQDGDLEVNNNLGAVVTRNAVNGDISCIGNAELDAGGNRASGDNTCIPQ